MMKGFEERESSELVVALEGYEGPIETLLALARAKRIDLSQISILEVVDQCLLFIAAGKQLALDLAADYLVMAAVLAYLKSLILLPEAESGEEPPEIDPEEALRRHRLLELLEAMGRFLEGRPQLGRDVFLRGAPEGLPRRDLPAFELGLFELLRAYGEGRRREENAVLRIERPPFYTIEEALLRLSRLVGRLSEWCLLFDFAPDQTEGEAYRRAALAATLSASLELARRGRVELRQERPFGPIYLRSGARIAGERGERSV